MSKFVRSNSVAVTWGRDSCQIVALRVRKSQVEVRGFWSKPLTKETKPSNLIAQGVKALGIDDASYIAAGGNTHGWGFADLSMPAMPEQEMRSALGFELKRHTPVSADKLCWGYRELPGGRRGRGGRRGIRLFYIRREAWDQWIGNLGTLSHVDCVLPAPLALNPLFLGRTVSLPDFEDRALYRYTVEEGGTGVSRAPWDEGLTIGEALPGMAIRTGGLGSLPLEEQQRFIPAILLGIYACTQEFVPGQRTLIPVPQHLRIKRNIASKIIALLLCVYIAGGVGLASLRRLQHTAGEIGRVDLEIARVRNQLQAVREQNRQSHSEFAEELRTELVENTPSMPPLPRVLLGLTSAIEPPAWISQKLEWNAGLVTFTLNSPQNDLELISRLEDMPILGDVRQLSSSFVKGSYVRRIQLNARYDTPLEKENLARRVHDEAVRRRDESGPSGKEPPPDGRPAPGDGGAEERQERDGARDNPPPPPGAAPPEPPGETPPANHAN